MIQILINLYIYMHTYIHICLYIDVSKLTFIHNRVRHISKSSITFGTDKLDKLIQLVNDIAGAQCVIPGGWTGDDDGESRRVNK